MNGPLVLLKTGDAVPPVQRARGDFEVLFREGLGVDLELVQVHKGDPLPLARGLAGVVVTGSSASVYDPDDWIAEAAGFVLGASSLGVPILGVCFGHQLVADALGGQVVRSPKGREMGTVTVALTAEGRADPLFAGLPDLLQVQESHQDVVVRLPPGAVRLAGNQHTEVQAFALADHVRAVQFHPEFDATVSRGYLEARADRVAAEAEARGEDPEAAVAAVRASIRDSDHGRTLLGNWLDAFVRAG